MMRQGQLHRRPQDGHGTLGLEEVLIGLAVSHCRYRLGCGSQEFLIEITFLNGRERSIPVPSLPVAPFAVLRPPMLTGAGVFDPVAQREQLAGI
jgi:hypothetical protein